MYGCPSKRNPNKRCILIIFRLRKVSLSTRIHDTADTTTPVLQECCLEEYVGNSGILRVCLQAFIVHRSKRNTCMVRLPQCTNPCSFILVHAVVLADKLQKFDKLLLALGLHLVFVQTLAVVFQPVQQGVFLSSVARRCPMVALHKSIHLLVIDVPCFFICHVILF